MPDWMSRERRDLIRSFGAEIVSVTGEQGGFVRSIQMAEAFAAGRHDVFLPRQFSNENNSEAHYRTTSAEIWLQFAAAGVRLDAFVAGIGGFLLISLGRNASFRQHLTRFGEEMFNLMAGCNSLTLKCRRWIVLTKSAP